MNPQIAALPKLLPAPESQGSAGSGSPIEGEQGGMALWLWGAFLLELTGLSAGLPRA